MLTPGHDTFPALSERWEEREGEGDGEGEDMYPNLGNN